MKLHFLCVPPPCTVEMPELFTTSTQRCSRYLFLLAQEKGLPQKYLGR